MSTTEGSGSHKSDDSSSSLAAPNDYEIVNEASKVSFSSFSNIQCLRKFHHFSITQHREQFFLAFCTFIITG